MAVHFGLLHRALHGNHNIAQHGSPRLLVDVIMVIFAQRKAQYIGGGGLVAVLLIQLGNFLIIDKNNADFRIAFKFFVFQRRIARAAN